MFSIVMAWQESFVKGVEMGLWKILSLESKKHSTQIHLLGPLTKGTAEAHGHGLRGESVLLSFTHILKKEE